MERRQEAQSKHTDERLVAEERTTMTETTDERRKLPLWCSLVETAMQTAAASGKPFTEAALDSIGIFAWSPYRARALAYAEKIIAARRGSISLAE
jgi:hypothetical protein